MRILFTTPGSRKCIVRSAQKRKHSAGTMRSRVTCGLFILNTQINRPGVVELVRNVTTNHPFSSMSQLERGHSRLLTHKPSQATRKKKKTLSNRRSKFMQKEKAKNKLHRVSIITSIIIPPPTEWPFGPCICRASPEGCALPMLPCQDDVEAEPTHQLKVFQQKEGDIMTSSIFFFITVSCMYIVLGAWSGSFPAFVVCGIQIAS